MSESGKSEKVVRRALVGGLACLITTVCRADWSGEISSSTWALPASSKVIRWLDIHNLSDARSEGLYHIEVLERSAGDPVWKFKRLVPHMAITESALRASVSKPIKMRALTRIHSMPPTGNGRPRTHRGRRSFVRRG
jgi:hypothetical protein